LFTLGLGLTTPYSLGILVWSFYQTFVTVSIEFWLRFESHIRPTRLTINVLFVTVRVERNVRLCVKLFDFFRGWILIRLTWNLSRFVPNSVESLGWNFRKKLFREKLVKFGPNFCNLIQGPYCAEKNSHKHFRMLFAPRQGGTSINELQKEDMTFCFRKTGFVHSRSGTYYALLLGYFGLKFLLDICHCVYWVLAEI